MTEHECIVGLYLDERNGLVTLTNIEAKISETIRWNESLDRDAAEWGLDVIEVLKRKEYTLKDFLDRRKNTPLIHFDYCPECGKKINWKAMRNEYDRARP